MRTNVETQDAFTNGIVAMDKVIDDFASHFRWSDFG